MQIGFYYYKVLIFYKSYINFTKDLSLKLITCAIIDLYHTFISGWSKFTKASR